LEGSITALLAGKGLAVSADSFLGCDQAMLVRKEGVMR